MKQRKREVYLKSAYLNILDFDLDYVVRTKRVSKDDLAKYNEVITVSYSEVLGILNDEASLGLLEKNLSFEFSSKFLKFIRILRVRNPYLYEVKLLQKK